ncbi:MAG: hypothetical protein IT195_11455 [Microthrixaceae bacterium]|nr:hypothetical protein [Microthrixaceae bacterium]
MWFVRVQGGAAKPDSADPKGVRYLARMLAEPGREFHVLGLAAVEQGTLLTGRPEAVGDIDLGPAGSGLPPAPSSPNAIVTT